MPLRCVKSGDTGGPMIRLLFSLHHPWNLTHSTTSIMLLYMLHRLHFYCAYGGSTFLQTATRFLPIWWESHHVFIHSLFLYPEKFQIHTKTHTHTHIPSLCASNIDIYSTYYMDTHKHNVCQNYQMKHQLNFILHLTEMLLCILYFFLREKRKRGV